MYGIRIASLIAGFAGSVVSLSYLPPMTLWRAIIAVVTGTASAVYVTPLAFEMLRGSLPSTSASAENAVAFLIGLTAMRTIPPLIDGSSNVVSRILGAVKSNG